MGNISSSIEHFSPLFTLFVSELPLEDPTAALGPAAQGGDQDQGPGAQLPSFFFYFPIKISQILYVYQHTFHGYFFNLLTYPERKVSECPLSIFYPMSIIPSCVWVGAGGGGGGGLLKGLGTGAGLKFLGWGGGV